LEHNISLQKEIARAENNVCTYKSKKKKFRTIGSSPFFSIAPVVSKQ